MGRAMPGEPCGRGAGRGGWTARGCAPFPLPALHAPRRSAPSTTLPPLQQQTNTWIGQQSATPPLKFSAVNIFTPHILHLSCALSVSAAVPTSLSRSLPLAPFPCLPSAPSPFSFPLALILSPEVSRSLCSSPLAELRSLVCSLQFLSRPSFFTLHTRFYYFSLFVALVVFSHLTPPHRPPSPLLSDQPGYETLRVLRCSACCSDGDEANYFRTSLISAFGAPRHPARFRTAYSYEHK